MRIIVYQGDENRAKIEKELTGDIFFCIGLCESKLSGKGNCR